MRNFRLLLLGSALSVPALAPVAVASPIPSSMSFVIGLVSASPTPIAGGSTFNLGFAATGTGMGAFDVVPFLTTVTFPSLTATGGSPFTYTINGYGTYAGTVTGVTVENGNNAVVTIASMDGIFTPLPSGPLGGYIPGPASAIFSANQTGGGANAIAASFTSIWLADTQGGGGQDVIPTPMSLALFGAGLAALGLVRARRREG